MGTLHLHPRPALWRCDVVRCVEHGRPPYVDWDETADVVATAWGRTAAEADAEAELARCHWDRRHAGPGEFAGATRPVRVTECACDACGDWCAESELHELTIAIDAGVDGADVPLCAGCLLDLFGEELPDAVDEALAYTRDEMDQTAEDFRGRVA